MNENIIIIFTISAVVLISPYIAKFFKLPTAPIEIILGSIAGYFTLLNPANTFFLLISKVGFYYLMFLAGTEVNLNLLFKLDKKIFIIGGIYIFLLYFISFLFVLIFDLPILFVFMFSLISVGLIMALFKEFGKDKKWLNLSMNIGILGELVSIILFTIVESILANGIGLKLVQSILLLTIFMLSVYLIFKIIKIVFWWHPEWKHLFIPKFDDKDEKDIRTSMSIFFFMIALMSLLHLEIAFGAFIAGMFIATFFEHKEHLPHKLASFGFGFLIPIFFVYVGSTFDIAYLLDKTLVLNATIFTIIMIIVRIIASFILYQQLYFQERLLFALSHTMPLTLLIAIVTIAFEHRAISATDYYSFVLASLFEVIISMFIIIWLGKKVANI